MPFVRVSLMTPKPGQEQRVEQLLNDLVEFYQGRKGFITAYWLRPHAHRGAGRYGRISVWETEEDANATAQQQRDASLQSELKLATVDDTHEEYGFEGITAAASRA